MSSLNKIENSQRSQSSALPPSDYMPQHPLYTLNPEPITIDNDHLYNYVETRPFEKSEPRKARNRNVEIEKLTKEIEKLTEEIGKMKQYDYNRLKMGLRKKSIKIPNFDGKETSLSPENIERIKGLMKEKTKNIKIIKEVMKECTKETIEQKKKLQKKDKKHLSDITKKYLKQMSEIRAMYENEPRSRTTEKIEFIEREIEDLLIFFEKLKNKKKITEQLQKEIDTNLERVKKLENKVLPWELSFAGKINDEPRQQPIHEDSEWSLCVIT